jgi:hypothetical protein
MFALQRVDNLLHWIVARECRIQLHECTPTGDLHDHVGIHTSAAGRRYSHCLACRQIRASRGVHPGQGALARSPRCGQRQANAPAQDADMVVGALCASRPSTIALRTTTRQRTHRHNGGVCSCVVRRNHFESTAQTVHTHACAAVAAVLSCTPARIADLLCLLARQVGLRYRSSRVPSARHDVAQLTHVHTVAEEAR